MTWSSPSQAGIVPDAERLLLSLDRAALSRYEPDPAGPVQARTAVARWYAERGELVDPEDLLLSASTSEAYSHILRSFSETGDTVLVPNPGYPLLDVLCSLSGLKTVGYPLIQEMSGRWILDRERFPGHLEHVAAVMAVAPANPMGSGLDADDWIWLAQVTNSMGALLVIDEVFSDFLFVDARPRPDVSVLSDHVPLLLVHGLSKLAGLPGVKAAWIRIACGGRQAERGKILDALHWVADAYLGLSSLASALLPAALDYAPAWQKRVMERLSENRRILATLQEEPGLRVALPEGGWYCSVRCMGEDEEAIAFRLLSEGILVQPGYLFDFEEDGWVVCSLLSEPSHFAESLDRLRSICQDG